MINYIDLSFKLLVGVFFLLVCYYDIVSRTIPNKLIFFIFIVLLARSILVTEDFNFNFIFFLLMTSIMLISYASGWFGGGDVKLIIAISPFVTHGSEILFLQIVGGAGLILSFIFSLRRLNGNKTGHIELPFGVAISTGFLFSVLLH